MKNLFAVLVLCVTLYGAIGAPVNINVSNSNDLFMEMMDYNIKCPMIHGQPFMNDFIEPLISYICPADYSNVDVRSVDGLCYGSADCSNNGVCSNNTCVCYPGFVTFPDSSTSMCNYPQKLQLTAFLLQFFLGTCGAGQFYLGNIGNAVGQLIVLVGPVLVGCCCCCAIVGCSVKAGTKNADCGMACGIICLYLLIGVGIAIVAIWWLIDTILIGTNHYLDGNGIPVKSW